MDNIKLNVELLRQRVPNLTVSAASVGLRPATVSNLCTGKIPLGRAEIRTLVALAKLADCSVDELIIHTNEAEMIETGIKVVDLFAPLTRGGTIGFVARPGMGQLVMLAEIFHRMNLEGYETFFLKPNEEGPGLEDVINETKFVCQSPEEFLVKISKIKEKQNIILAADRQTVITGEIYTLIEKLQEAGMSITTLLVDLRGEVMDEIEPYGPLDTLWQFDAELNSRKIYPAINPIYSTSVLLEGAHLERTHMQAQQQARKLLRRYRELRFIDIEKMSATDKEIYHRGLRLEAYFTQPFLITESFTKKQGTSVPLRNTISMVQKIVKGELDEIEVEALMFRDKLEEEK
jgi:F-type H+/Na+-transporting ATPase subunit beta